MSLKNKKKELYWIKYTVLFLLFFAVAFFWYAVEGKTFIWKEDGLNQHYPALVYISQYFRIIIKNILQGNFAVPMWDLKIGFGGDVLTNLNYYGFGDPLNLLSVFFKKNQIVYCYNFLIVLRYFLAGVTFSLYCFKRKRDSFETLIGSMLYIFVGYALVAFRHPFFLNAFIYLPIVLGGIDDLFEKRDSRFFVFGIVLSAISNFYFLYMIALIAFLYALITYVLEYNEGIKFFLQIFLLFLRKFFIALGISAFILLPVILVFLGNTRGDADFDFNLLHYPLKYYEHLLSSMLSVDIINNWTMVGFNTIVLLGIIVLFTQRGKYRKYKSFFIILTGFLFLPFAGYAMNGFSYITNRWLFAYAFIGSYIAVIALPVLLKGDFSKKQKKIIHCIVLFIFVYAIVGRKIFKFNCVVPAVLLMVATFLLINFQVNKSTKKIIVTGIALISLFVTSYTYQIGDGKNKKTEGFVSVDDLMSAQNGMKALCSIEDDEVYRVQDMAGMNGNHSLWTGLNTTTSFYSLMEDDVVTPSKKLGNTMLRSASTLKGYSNRAGLLSLAGVKYITVNDDKKAMIPYGFTKTRINYNGVNVYGTNERGSVYKNQFSLPIGYLYENILSQNQYDKLTISEREIAEESAAITKEEIPGIETYSGHSIQTKTLLNKDKLIKEITQNRNIQYKNGKLYVSKDNTKVSCEYQNPDKDQVNFEITGLKVKYDGFSSKKGETSLITLGSIGIANKESYITGVRLTTPQDIYYIGQEDFAANLGNGKEEKLRLQFSKAGIYELRDMCLVARSTKQYEQNMKELKTNSMEAIKFGTNKIEGVVKADKKSVLCMAIPYSKGWSVKVNGNNQKAFKINDKYMGIVVEKGRSKISFSYKTQGLQEGMLISIITVLCVCFYARRKRRKN